MTANHHEPYVNGSIARARFGLSLLGDHIANSVRAFVSEIEPELHDLSNSHEDGYAHCGAHTYAALSSWLRTTGSQFTGSRHTAARHFYEAYAAYVDAVAGEPQPNHAEGPQGNLNGAYNLLMLAAEHSGQQAAAAAGDLTVADIHDAAADPYSVIRNVDANTDAAQAQEIEFALCLEIGIDAQRHMGAGPIVELVHYLRSYGYAADVQGVPAHSHHTSYAADH